MHIGGRLINDVPPKDRDIAMVFQSYALYPHMTVYKNIAFGLELRKTPKDEIQRTAGRETSGGFLCLGDEVQNAPGEVRFSWAPFGTGHFMRPDWIALQAETDRL